MMTNTMTAAQRKALRTLTEQGPQLVTLRHRAPFEKLVEMGLATYDSSTFTYAAVKL